MASEVRSYTVSVFQTISIASRSPHKTFSPDVGCVRYVRTQFCLSKPHQRRRRKPPTNPLLPLRPIGIPREMTDKDGNLLWFGNYTGWGCLKEETKVTDSDTTPFACRTSMPTLRRGYITTSSGIMSRMRGGLLIRTRFGWWGDAFAPNTQDWLDLLGLCSNSKLPNADKAIIDPKKSRDMP